MISHIDVTRRYDREVDKKIVHSILNYLLSCVRLHIMISARESVFRRRRAFGPRRQIFVKGLVGILKRGIKTELFIICERPRETYLSALLYIVCVILATVSQFDAHDKGQMQQRALFMLMSRRCAMSLCLDEIMWQRRHTKVARINER